MSYWTADIFGNNTALQVEKQIEQEIQILFPEFVSFKANLKQQQTILNKTLVQLMSLVTSQEFVEEISQFEQTGIIVLTALVIESNANMPEWFKQRALKAAMTDPESSSDAEWYDDQGSTGQGWPEREQIINGLIVQIQTYNNQTVDRFPRPPIPQGLEDFDQTLDEQILSNIENVQDNPQSIKSEKNAKNNIKQLLN